MNFIQKFYNADAEQSGGSSEVNIAELMAKQGYNSENRPAERMVEDKGNNEQVETEVEVQAATASAETKVETLVQEAEKPSEVVVAKTETKVEEKPTTTPTWQEVLKQQQPDSVLKELLGVDDSKVGLINTLKDLPPQMVGLIDTWKSNGDLVAYLKEMTTDYSKMSSEDVMRNQLRLDYPKASEKQIEILFKREVVDAYSLDTEKYSEEEVEEGKLLLDAKADKFRDVLTQRQQAFIIPKAPEVAAVESDNSEQDAATANFEVYKSTVSSDPYTKNVFTNKQITIGEGDEQFNFPVEPTELTDILFNNEKWVAAINNITLDQNGKKVFTPDIEKQMILGAVAKYGKSFLIEYAKHFKAIGGKSVIEPLENASPTKSTATAASEIKPASAAEAMAKHGYVK